MKTTPTMTPKKQKLKDLLNRLNELDQKAGGVLSAGTSDLSALAQSVIKEESDALRGDLKNRPIIQAFDKLAKEFSGLKAHFDFNSVKQLIESADRDSENRLLSLAGELEKRFASAGAELAAAEKRGTAFTTAQMRAVLGPLQALQENVEEARRRVDSERALLSSEVSRLSQGLKKVQDKLGEPKDGATEATLAQNVEDTKKASEAAREALESIEDLRQTVIRRINSIQQGSGNANRDIRVNSNSSTLARYGDINMIASSNVTIAVRDNNNTKFTEFVISATGGSGTPAGASGQIQYNDGGSFGASSTLSWDKNASVFTVGTFNLPADNGDDGQFLQTRGNGVTQWASVTGSGGLTRSVSVLSVSSTMAAAATTDYVFFPNVGIQLTLPTAVGNSNLYTVKNMAASSVLVAAATGQDIDGSTTVLMPTQYESLTFVSNNSVWGVT